MAAPTKPHQTHDSLSNGGQAFRRSLINWFEDNAKDYAWRRTQDPYAILVSELMLQQTQIATVLEHGYYDRWMQRFPNAKALALADETEVLKHWEGLGYYSRARNLQSAAKIISTDLSGNFPTTAVEIERLPGVGPYTAGAVASFAFDLPAAIVDGNVARVLARIFDLREAVDSGPGNKLLWELARQLMPKRKNAKSREYNSALMELGQRICKRASPLCGKCPVAHYCATRDPVNLPVKKQRAKTELIEEHVMFCVRKNAVLLEQEQGSRRKGLWKLPELQKKNSGEKQTHTDKPILTLKYSITKYRVTMKVYQARASKASKGRWVTFEELDDLTLGAPYRRALGKLI
ncbi:MAG: A/G-specific adenine glycosylase [Verrucomicrobia bacterium]|nr:A/G-specific adenine glycosylase [Verrucomicrobiota bacterium]